MAAILFMASILIIVLLVLYTAIVLLFAEEKKKLEFKSHLHTHFIQYVFAIIFDIILIFVLHMYM